MKGRKLEILELLADIEHWECRALHAMNASPEWEPPRLHVLETFRIKWPKPIHPLHRDYYIEQKQEAYRIQASLLRTQLRIAKDIATTGQPPAVSIFTP